MDLGNHIRTIFRPNIELILFFYKRVIYVYLTFVCVGVGESIGTSLPISIHCNSCSGGLQTNDFSTGR